MVVNNSRRIVVVTGANSGVGFGICQRLLYQLCELHPSDTLPQAFVTNATQLHLPSKYDTLTLVMACRNPLRAGVARERLLQLLDTHVEKLRRSPGYDGHADEFRRGVKIDMVTLDLLDLRNVFYCAKELSLRYPYVSCLICNAGIISFSHMDWVACFKQLFTNPIMAITAPNYYRQKVGELSKDGLGMVWQANLFGHYVFYRSLHGLLTASPDHIVPRVIWMSSLEASSGLYSDDDWQLKLTAHPYESSKQQTDIIATLLDRYALHSEGPRPVRHFVTHPGVCSTNVSQDVVGPFLDVFKVISFYVARLLGSPHHTIDPFKAAIGAVHLAIASVSFTTLWPASMDDGDVPPPRQPAKFGAETSRWGKERVGLNTIKEWENEKDYGEVLLAKCDALFQSFKSP